jgi:hypothetical protein
MANIRVYEVPTTESPPQIKNYINVNEINQIRVSSQGNPPTMYHVSLVIPGATILISFSTEEEALEEAQLWRDRVDDAP